MSSDFLVTFNGIDITSTLRVNHLNRGVRLGRSPNYRVRRNRLGVDRGGYTSQLITFPMEFMICDDIKAKREQLIEILNVTEPKPLTFSDEPGKVYYAIPRSDIPIQEIFILGKGTIIWEIPDGVSYSVPTYTFTNEDINGIFQNYIMVDNPGTEPMELEMEARFTSDNGFLGIESSDGTVRALFGDMAEVDKTPYELSELLFDDHLYTDRSWALNSGVVPPVTPNPSQQGAVAYRTEYAGEGYAYPSSYGTPTNDWSGPSLTKTVPADSSGSYPVHWTSNFRIDFNPDKDGVDEHLQVGHQSITYVDQNDNIIVSLVFEDNYANARRSDFAIYIRDKRVYDSRNTSYYYITARPGDANHISVEKWENTIAVMLKGEGGQTVKLQFPLNEGNVQLRKTTWYAARYKSLPVMTNNLIRAINLSAHKVQKWQDIPNKFKSGDILEYGQIGRNVSCTVNGLNELRLRDVGSTLISVPPGRTILYLAYSNFADTPEVILQGRAKYTI